MNLIPLFLLPPKILLSIAQKRNTGGKKREALRAVDKALNKLAARSSSPRNVAPDTSSQVKKACLLKGHIHKDLGDYADAMRSFLWAYKLGGEDIGALEFLTSELLKAKDLSPLARSIYLDYLSGTNDAGNSGQARRNLKLLEALSAPDWGRPETFSLVESWNEEVASRRSDLAWPYRNLGTIALYFYDWEQGSQLLRKALALNRNDCVTLLNLSYALFREGQAYEAKEHLDRLIESHPGGGAFLLRAHVLRALGDYAGAALDYRRVAESDLFTDEERWAYAEVCINAGYFKEALRQLNILPDHYDPRWLLMSALVDRAEKRDGEALAKFHRVISSEKSSDELCSQAVAQILSLLGKNPEAQGALDALDDVPSYCEDDLYWTVRGNVLLGLGQIEEALDAWNQILYPSFELRHTVMSTARHYLAGLYNAGLDLEVIDAVRTGLISETASDEVAAEIIVSALSRHVLARLNGAHGSKKLLKAIDLVSGHLSSPSLLQRLDLLRGLVYVSLCKYQKALATFSSLPSAVMKNEEVALQMARCALHAGATDDCLKALEALRIGDPRAGGIRTALAALEGDWDAAARYLSDLRSLKDNNEFRAAIFFRAGWWADLERLNGSAGSVVNHYRIAHLLRSGNHEDALQVMSSIQESEPDRALSNRLIGWLRLQSAKDYKVAGERERAAEILTEVLPLWPDSDGPAAYLERLDADLMRVLLLVAGGREGVGGVLKARVANHAADDPTPCHNLALFYFVNGELHATRGDFEGAIGNWEKSIAYLCVPLSNQTYMTEWANRRLEVYESYSPVEAAAHIEEQLLRYYEATFKKWSEHLAGRAMPAQAARLSDLPLALRAELQGARMLTNLGGFSVTSRRAAVLCAGPMFISMMGWERSFALFLSRLKIKQAISVESNESDPLNALLDLMAQLEAEEKEGAVDISVKERVEKLFSVMRFAAVREAEGNLEAALQRLREVKGAYEPMTPAVGRHRVKSPRRRGDVNLTLHSPAFARDRSPKRFRELVAKYEVELLTALGEQEIASLDGRLASGIQYWREALALARDGEQHSRVVGSVQETALGRAYVLQDKRETAEAIRLLEEVDALCGGEELRALLSRLYAIEGVSVYNKSGDLEQAITNLRHAVSLNPHSLYAQGNLARVLSFQVDDLRDEDPAWALILLDEAMDAISACRDLDVDNEEYRRMEVLTKAKVNLLRIRAGEISMEELPPEDLVGLLLLTEE
jgi:tetratricopeptide (TPR) repeat protein